MHERSLRLVPAPAPRCSADDLRARIARLLGDPGVAARVRRRLAAAEEAAARERPGTPPCLRAPDGAACLPALVGSDLCRAACRSVDCLCGRYPRRLSEQEIRDGRARAPLAV
jgi:hypothetical protein